MSYEETVDFIHNVVRKELDAAIELEKKATAGPWSVSGSHLTFKPPSLTDNYVVADFDMEAGDPTPFNIELCAYLRNNADYLLFAAKLMESIMETAADICAGRQTHEEAGMHLAKVGTTLLRDRRICTTCNRHFPIEGRPSRKVEGPCSGCDGSGWRRG